MPEKNANASKKQAQNEATAETTTLSPLVSVSGAGKAYQSVAQAAAIAVQDATDYLRNVSTISTTAMGVALSQLLASGDGQDDRYEKVLSLANSLLNEAAQNFKTIGDISASILNQFPKEDSD